MRRAEDAGRRRVSAVVLVTGLSVVVALPRSNALAINTSLSGFYKNLFSVTDVGNNFRNLGVARHDVAVDDFQRLRLKLNVNASDALDLQLHYEVRMVWGETMRIQDRLAQQALLGSSPISARFSQEGRARFLDLEKTPVEESTVLVGHDLDRLRVRWVTDAMEWSVGRQAVSWGTGRIWTPTDLFSGFAPTEIDRDEKLGVDVIRATWTPDPSTSIDVIGEPLDNRKNYSVDTDDSSLAARGTLHVGEYEVSLIGGIIAGDEVIGGDWTGYLKDAGFRGEWIFTAVDEPDERDYFRGLLSVDYGFAAMWNPYLALEYFYNGLGTDDPDRYLDRLGAASVQRAFSRGNAFNIGRNYIGLAGSVTPTALLSLGWTSLWNMDDNSFQEFVTASWSLSDNVDLVAGADIGLGGRGTEFDGFSETQAGVEFESPDFYFAFLKIYF